MIRMQRRSRVIDLQASEDSGASERDAESDEDKKIQKELEFLK